MYDSDLGVENLKRFTNIVIDKKSEKLANIIRLNYEEAPELDSEICLHVPLPKNLKGWISKSESSPSNKMYGKILTFSYAHKVLPYGKYIYTIGEHSFEMVPSKSDGSWRDVAAEGLRRHLEEDQRLKAERQTGMKKGKEVLCEAEFVNDCLFPEGKMPNLDILYLMHLNHNNLSHYGLRPVEVEVYGEGQLCPATNGENGYYPLAAKFVPEIVYSCVRNGYVIGSLYIGNESLGEIELIESGRKSEIRYKEKNWEIPENIIKEIKAFNARSE